MHDRGLEVGATTLGTLGCTGLFGWGPQAQPNHFQQIGLDMGVDRDVADPVLVH